MARVEYKRTRWRAAVQFAAVIAAAAGLARLAGPVATRLQQRRLPPGWRLVRPPHEVSALALQGEIVWAGGAGGLFAIHRRTGEVRRPAGAPRMTYVRDLLPAHGLWVAHREGVSRMENGAWRTWTPAAGPFTALCRTPDGLLWAGGERALAVLENGAWRVVTTSEKLNLAGIDAIVRDSSGALWIASSAPTGGGLVRYDGVAFENWTGRRELPHPSVSAVFEARDGTLWFATGFGRRGGAASLKAGVWRTLTRNDGLAGDKVRSIYEDRNGSLWVGSEYDGIAVLRGAEARVFTPGDGLSGWEVKEMLEDQDGVYWLATEDGVTAIAPTGVRR
jgi:ligand-binding sensor domain-containing protein